ncbi:MAG: carbamoyltransferase HypF, partial [Clostridia bacterium]|nr:carbamoyltransferase HypF [Clostridia bacterium]
LGFAFDGTGYGTDGTVWGGEVFEYKNNEFTRKFHLKPVKMLGGDEISKNAETALKCYFLDTGMDIDDKLIKTALDMNINTVNSSSMGRLFDAVSAILGICNYNTYEGKCAVMLEIAASKAEKPYSLTLPLLENQWDTSSLIKQIADAKGDVCEILGFHHAIANAVVEVCEKSAIKNIALSGGVFMNRILTELCIDKLRKKGYNVYINRQVPTNDGGIALGQAYIQGKRVK